LKKKKGNDQLDKSRCAGLSSWLKLSNVKTETPKNLTRCGREATSAEQDKKGTWE